MTFKNQTTIQAREGLSEEKLSEYKDIFSFFDRWQEEIILQKSLRDHFSSFLCSGTVAAPSPLLSLARWAVLTNFWKLKVKRSFVWFFVRSTNFFWGFWTAWLLASAGDADIWLGSHWGRTPGVGGRNWPGRCSEENFEIFLKLLFWQRMETVASPSMSLCG